MPINDLPLISPRDGDMLRHDALLYRDAARLRDVVGGFAGDAAAADEQVLALLSPASLGLLQDVLAESRAAVDVLDAGEAGHNPRRLIPTILTWLDDRPGRARVTL